MTSPDIKFKTINEHFSYGKYLDETVIVMNKNGFINGTEFCLKYGKDITEYLELSRCNEMMIAIEKIKHVPKNEQIIIVDKNKLKKVLGIYVHNKLMADIAAWSSQKLYIKITDIINIK